MLYDDEDVMPRYLLSETTLIPCRGRAAGEETRGWVGAAFTREELDAVAPLELEDVYILQKTQQPDDHVCARVQARIMAAHRIKYGRSR